MMEKLLFIERARFGLGTVWANRGWARAIFRANALLCGGAMRIGDKYERAEYEAKCKISQTVFHQFLQFPLAISTGSLFSPRRLFWLQRNPVSGSPATKR
jgi:hypothetical protein